MIRRGLITLAATAGIAAAASGCGGSSAKSPLDDALGYLPKTTPVAIAVKTDLKDPQYHNLDTLLKRFPFYTLIKQRIASGFTIGGTKTSFAEVKKLLGNGFPHAASGSSLSSATVVAWKTKDGKKAATLVGRTGRKVGSENGATLYEEANGNVDAIKGDVLVSAKSRPLVDAALKQRGSSDRLREDIAGAPALQQTAQVATDRFATGWALKRLGSLGIERDRHVDRVVHREPPRPRI